MRLTANVNNLPGYASGHEYVVARCVDGELWFWGAYDELDNARDAAEDVEGCVLFVED